MVLFSLRMGSRVTFRCHVSLVSFDLEKFLRLSLFFITSPTIFEEAILIYKVFLNLGLSVSSLFDSAYAFLTFLRILHACGVAIILKDVWKPPGQGNRSILLG